MFHRRANHSRYGILTLLFCAGSLWIGCSDSGDSPTQPDPTVEVTLDSILPARTYPGDSVTLSGSGFGSAQGTVLFSTSGGTASGVVSSWGDTEISAMVPAAAVAGPVVVVEEGGVQSGSAAFAIAPEISLEDHVRPIFNAQGCAGCHGGTAGLTLDTRETILAGGGRGPAVVPRRSAESNLIKALMGDGIPLMPQGASESIPSQQILVIADWIDQGARDN